MADRPTTPGEIVGRNVRAVRERQLLSQRELAERSGVPKNTIAVVELGKSAHPRRRTIEKLASALGVPVELLLSEEPISPLADASPSQEKLFNNSVLVGERRGSVFREAIADAAEKWLAVASDPNMDPRKVFGVATAALGLAHTMGAKLRSGVQHGTLSPDERQELFQTVARLVEVVERYADRVENGKTRTQIREQIRELREIA